MALNLDYKRLALILGFILVVVGIGLAIYFVFFRNVFGPTNANENINGQVTLPLINGNRNVGLNTNTGVTPLPNINGAPAVVRPVADGGLTQTATLVDTVPGGAAVANNGRDLLYYDPLTGQFYQLSPDGRTRTALTDQIYPGASGVTWSPQKNKAVIEFPDGSKYLYDFQQQQQYTLAPEMTDISFSPTSSQISFKFIGETSDDSFLVVSNPDGTNSRTVEPLGTKADQFEADWSPAGNVIGTFHQSIDANRQEVIPIGAVGENFSAFQAPGRGFESSWSPAGDKMLYSVFTEVSGYNPTLYIADGTPNAFGANNVSLDLQTWSWKCTFSNAGTDLFCAVPQYLDQGTGLFPGSARSIPDDFYRIDLTTGQKQLIARPVGTDGTTQYSASQLFVSADGTLLYFFDSVTQKIQKIQLK